MTKEDITIGSYIERGDFFICVSDRWAHNIGPVIDLTVSLAKIFMLLTCELLQPAVYSD